MVTRSHRIEIYVLTPYNGRVNTGIGSPMGNQIYHYIEGLLPILSVIWFLLSSVLLITSLPRKEKGSKWFEK
jgi:hypothetical protein